MVRAIWTCDSPLSVVPENVAGFKKRFWLPNFSSKVLTKKFQNKTSPANRCREKALYGRWIQKAAEVITHRDLATPASARPISATK